MGRRSYLRRYGTHPEQAAGLAHPAVLAHGGFWRNRYRRGLMAALADDLVAPEPGAGAPP
ncbi:MAG TPA: hypothetical protein VGW75_11095 [Solirubrobacteraceae bacterium]|jgi:hypothetical protein|nr:hypothetical protein [Solirubrobacteraceae bacterium]